MADAVGCKVQTIRYYEQIGLLPEPDRSPGNQRLYSREHVDRIRFVRHGRALGFTLDEIRELLTLSDHPDRPCADVDAIARRHKEEVESKIAKLEALRNELDRMISDCDGGQVSECRIIKILSDHGLCISEKH